MRKKLITLLVVVFSLALVSIAIADNYATTRVYFMIPSATTFAIAMPTAYSNTSIVGTTEATATPTSPSWISFNFSSPPDSWKEPSAGGVFTDNQSLADNKPIFWIFNTGNVNETFTMYWNDTPDISYFNVSINGSCHPNAGLCNQTLATATNLTSAPLQFVNGTSPNGGFNLTMWGFAEADAPGGESTDSANIITNNSAT